MKLFVAFVSGFIFALGLGLSRMTQPEKVVGFLDITGNWDPSLLWVMVGAIGVHFWANVFAKKMKAPWKDDVFHFPRSKQIDPQLVVGSVLFGLGWGMIGFCPGPAVVSLAQLSRPGILVVFNMLAGMTFWRMFVARMAKIEQSRST